MNGSGGRILRALAGLLLAGGIAVWLLTGANRGWTKTSVPRKLVDEVTGIEGVAYERHFVPGLDFLTVMVLSSGLLAAASLLCRNRSSVAAHSEERIS